MIEAPTQRGARLWRHARPHRVQAEAPVARAVPLRGVGRVPLSVGDDVVVTVYSDPTRTYEWLRIDPDGREVWRATLPAGGYASPLQHPTSGRIVGPFDYSGYAEVDPASGEVVSKLHLARCVRSAPAPVDDGWVVAVSNRLVRFADGRELAAREVPGHIFFGRTRVYGGLGYAVAAARDGERTEQAVVAFDPDSLAIAWRRAVGPDFLIACDTSGVAIDREAGTVLVNAPDASVVALDASTGAIRWRTSLAGVSDLPVTNWRSAPAVAGGHVVVGTIEGTVACLDAASGELRWATDVDAIGVWSPPLLCRDQAIVHAGTRLVSVALADGAPAWATHVGFDAYTRPVLHGDSVVVAGGDPPLDGYLVWVRPDAAGPQLVDVRSEALTGRDSDALRLTLDFAEDVDEARLDLRAFGASGEDRCTRSGARRFSWYGPVKASKRLGETVIFGRATRGAKERQFSARVDMGADLAPGAPSARTLEHAELPPPQEHPLGSAGAVIPALAASYGRDMRAGDVEAAGRYMNEAKGVPPVHKWRGGACRIFMASRFPLIEEAGETVGAEDVHAVLDEWELAPGAGSEADSPGG